jgi:hypothetical protein
MSHQFGETPSAEMKQRMLDAKRKLREAGKDLRRDFADDPMWQERAKAHGIRLPAWHYGCTVKLMRQRLRRIGLTEAKYREMAGADCAHFAAHNPRWPLRAFVGVVLEMLDDA